MLITLLTARTTTNGAPSAATDGVVARKVGHTPTTRGLAGAQRGILMIESTAGSGVMTVTGKLWGYQNSKWFPLGTHATAATKGVINEGSAIGETGADSIRHAEVVENIGTFDRLYFEVTAIGGTATAVTVTIAGLPEVHA